MDAFDLSNGRGLHMCVLTYGGIITTLHAPDREGVLDDVVLGHDDLASYETASPYFGAIIGRCANRIAEGRFELEGASYQLATNNGTNHLHGGGRGFDKVVWSARVIAEETGPRLELSYTSAHGEEGYPGELRATVTYALTEGNELVIQYVATCDRPTPVNLTQHTYWNLAGSRGTDILDHELLISADAFTPVDERLIPTGEIVAVAETPFDFRTSTAVGGRIDAADEQLRRAGGYDHNYVLRNPYPESLRHAARLHDPVSGRTIDVRTDEPGLQFYSGNFLDGSIRGKGGRQYMYRGGLCLETQHFPDSPNQDEFPSVILRPGREHRSRTVVAFSTDRERSALAQ